MPPQTTTPLSPDLTPQEEHNALQGLINPTSPLSPSEREEDLPYSAINFTSPLRYKPINLMSPDSSPQKNAFLRYNVAHLTSPNLSPQKNNFLRHSTIHDGLPELPLQENTFFTNVFDDESDAVYTPPSSSKKPPYLCNDELYLNRFFSATDLNEDLRPFFALKTQENAKKQANAPKQKKRISKPVQLSHLPHLRSNKISELIPNTDLIFKRKRPKPE